MRTIEDLKKPEQIRALEMLKSCLPEFDASFVKQLDTNTMFPTNYFTFFSELVHLPHGEYWLWNQSNAKVTVKLDDYVVLMQKMNTRRRKNGPKAPFYKLWLYSLKNEDGDFSAQFIWCEKGDSVSKSKTSKKKEVQSPTLCSTSNSPTYINEIQDTQTSAPQSPILEEISVQPTVIIPQQNYFNELELIDTGVVDSILYASFLYSDQYPFISAPVFDNTVCFNEEILF